MRKITSSIFTFQILLLQPLFNFFQPSLILYEFRSSFIATDGSNLLSENNKLANLAEVKHYTPEENVYHLA